MYTVTMVIRRGEPLIWADVKAFVEAWRPYRATERVLVAAEDVGLHLEEGGWTVVVRCQIRG